MSHVVANAKPVASVGWNWPGSGSSLALTAEGLFCRTDVSKLKFEGKTFYVIGIQKEVSALCS